MKLNLTSSDVATIRFYLFNIMGAVPRDEAYRLGISETARIEALSALDRIEEKLRERGQLELFEETL